MPYSKRAAENIRTEPQWMGSREEQLQHWIDELEDELEEEEDDESDDSSEDGSDDSS